MKLILLGALLGFAAAKTIPQCVVSDWSDWSQCKGKCPQITREGMSWDAGVGTYYDEGRIKMKAMMEVKLEQRAHFWDCLLDNSCPDLLDPKFHTPGFAACEDGVADIYPCRNIDKLDFRDFVGLGTTANTEGNDIWGWKDPENGDDYAIVGTTRGSSMVRITDPQNIEVLGFLPTHTSASTWRDMKVVNDHAYIVSEASGHGLQVFDLTRLRGLSADPSRTFEVDLHYAGFGNAHNIAANVETETLFVIGATRSGAGYTPCSGGLHMINVADPKNPVFEGCYAADGYSHDVECVVYRGPDSRYTGREICWGYNENTLTLVDVTDRANPVQLSRKSYTGYQYTHQGWLTPDHRWALLDDELDEYYSSDKKTKTYIWDCSDLRNPVMTSIYRSPEDSIDHNMYIVERNGGVYVIQSNYESGLRILHMEVDTGELSEVAYFDVLPTRTTANFAGTWSNYPYDLKDGAIAMTSIDYGFFMVGPQWDNIEAEVAAKMAYAERERWRSILHYDEGATCPQLRQTEHCDIVQCN
jgi:choice-of-anchor B domain-containing protein